MIGALTGRPLSWQPPELLLDVNGVAYEVLAPSTLHFHDDETVRLYTHLTVREDQMQLYGFRSLEERNVFRTLLRISGIGAKMGLAILSTWQVDELMQIIRQEDLKALTRIPGVGKKTAEKLLVELKHRFDSLAPAAGGGVAAGTAPATLALPDDAVSLARQALENLGYTPAEAGRLLDAVAEEGLETAELIRRALKQAQTR
ncbi:Holliday junction branch migration protein RuvA [Sulfurivirga sp.]|uniref:Holliday junction branch migration protein RuvA n=1 Tax=Sulfurivirga sp. TaxID=2614236 RepID=UPI0025E90516|nr:Holliday junction branch migration protein RuvA [Sulfurivirga sp.]